MRHLFLSFTILLFTLLFAKSAQSASIWPNGTNLQTFANGVLFGTSETVKTDGTGKLLFTDANNVTNPVNKNLEADLLLNRSFEDSYSGNDAKNWTLTGATGTITTASSIDGSKHLSLSLSSTLSLSQDITATQYNPNVVSFSLWVKSSLTDLQLCGTLATVEQECVDYDGSDQWKKLQVLVTAPSSGAMGLKLKSLTSTAGTVLVDAGEFSSNPLKFASGLKTENISYKGYDSTATWIKFKTKESADINSLMLDDNSTYTKVTFLKPVTFSASVNAVKAAATDNYITIRLYNSAATIRAESYQDTNAGAEYGTSATLSYKANVGDYIVVLGNAPDDSNGTNFSVTAFYQTDQILTANDVVSSETINWAFKATAIVDSDPVGTYNTYSKGASSNTFTICGTAPTTLPNNSDGAYLKAVAYNATSNCTTDIGRFDIKIGKSLKGHEVSGYASTNKSGESLFITYSNTSATNGYGLQSLYNEQSGILTIDSSRSLDGSEAYRRFLSKSTEYTNGYFHFAASKNPVISALDAIPKIDYSWENTLTAISATSGTISDENVDFLDGDCTNAHPSVCTFKSGFFTAAPKCEADNNTDLTAMCAAYNVTATGMEIKCWTDAAANVTTTTQKKITCDRGGSDYRFQGGDVAAIIAQPTCYIKDVKASGTDGGTFTSGAWQTRTLNTTSGNCSFLSLSSNQITLQAGTYLIEASSPAFQVDYHKAKLRNITDSTDDIIGTSEYSAFSVVNSSNKSLIQGQVTIVNSKTYEVQHYCETTVGTVGLGLANIIPLSETYTQVKITKVR